MVGIISFVLSVTQFLFIVLELILYNSLLVGCSSPGVKICMFAFLAK